MKVVILAGGFGSRLAEETATVPKPMVEIGGKPILFHIMSLYGHHGFNEFVVACGHLGHVIRDYFSNLNYTHSDYTISLKDGRRTIVNPVALDWTVSLVDTGSFTMTGGRLKRLKDWLGDETFMCTYGDGVANLDIGALLAFHKAHGELATLAAVRPPPRFGTLALDGDRVADFSEKAPASEAWINGGFFVFEPSVLDYISGDDTLLEREPLTNLAREGRLMAFRHDGFWQPMDTLRDRRYLEELWSSGKAPWAIDR